mmetsp:Transcript_73223/g.138163  ORF Transcript_73223/g.138163 Transcript_73223/m.138163 type:complete len:285 (+) Transcript_73223:760-1614(+)
MRRFLAKRFHEVGLFFQQGKRGHPDAGDEGGRGGGEAVASSAQALVVTHLDGAAAQAPDGSHGVLQGDQHRIHVRDGQRALLGQPAPRRPQNPETQALVKNEAEPVRFLQVHNFFQRRHRTVDFEESFRDDEPSLLRHVPAQPPVLGSHFRQNPLQVRRVVVPEVNHLCPGELHPHFQGLVHGRVCHDQVAALGEGRHRGGLRGGGVAVGNRCLCAHKGCYRGLHLQVGHHGAVEASWAAGAAAVLVEGQLRARLELLAARQAQKVVGDEVDLGGVLFRPPHHH